MIRNLLIAGSMIALVAPSTLMAQSSFNGTWKFDFNSALPKKVNVWLLSDGTYKCTSCSPPVDVKADGQDQPVSGQPYDTISVKIIDRQTVELVEKKDGRTVSDEEFTVSSDGSTVTDEFGNWKVTMTRIAKAPLGAHELSGSWRPLKVEALSDKELLVTYELHGDGFSMSRPTGQSYMARLNGLDAPYKGDPDIDGVSLKRVGKNTIEETDKLNGKTVSVARMTVSPDGKYMSVSVRGVRHGTANRFTMRKE